MADLFDTASEPTTDTAPRPLADRLRPKTLDEVIGQEQVMGPDGPLGVMLKSGSLSSLIFWGQGFTKTKDENEKQQNGKDKINPI